MEDQGVQSSIQNQGAGVGFPGAPSTPSTNNKKNWKWLIVLILFLVVIGGVTFFVFKNSRSTTEEESPTPQESSVSNFATPEASPTPLASPINKSQLKIKVLNGTGIAGEASLLSDALKKLGYTNITTGNAENQNATDTTVIFGSNVASDVATEITGKLKDLYTNVTSNNSSLSDVDIQITTGLRKGQTSAPAAATGTPVASASPTATPAQ